LHKKRGRSPFELHLYHLFHHFANGARTISPLIEITFIVRVDSFALFSAIIIWLMAGV